MRVARGSRKTLIKTLERNEDRRTKSGIWLIGDTDWNPNVHAQRWGEIVKVPHSPLPFEVNVPGQPPADKMPWATDMDAVIGDIVFYDYLQSLNTQVYTDEEGSEYRLIDYENLYVSVSPDKKITPLNGYHLFELVYHKKINSFDHFSEKKINNKLGIVKYLAKNNKRYDNADEEDHVELQVGDKVQFGSVPAVMLEDKAHCVFDGGRMYRRSQARNIDLVWRGEELIPPSGRCLLKRIWDEKRTPAGIWLPRPNVKTHTGEIVVSSVDEIPVKSRVKYVMNAGRLLDYKGEQHRVVSDKHILYIE